MTAQQFLELRFAALSQGDYGSVYDSYHVDAPFLKQFQSRQSYIDFAQQQLGEIKLKTWCSLAQRNIENKQIEALLKMELSSEAGSQLFYELALLIKVDSFWTYHSAQKLGEDDYLGDPDQIDFHHFDNALQKIRF